MNDIVILHLSDLHIDDTARSYSKLLKGLISDIKSEVAYIPDHSLVVVVTGDIIHKGKKGAIPAAIKFFEDLYKVIKQKVAGIYLVPGNHDKCRTKENEFLIPAYRKMCFTEEKPFGKEFYNNFWKYQYDSYTEKNGSGYLELSKKVYEIFGIVSESENERKYIEDTFGVDIINIHGKNYCFVLLNTAWSCVDDQDTRKLILGQFQIDEVKKQFHEKTDDLENLRLTLVLGHHPIGCLFGKEEDKIFSEMISFEELSANAYLCGHTHDRVVINWVNNRHSINTFMTGIGWPEISSGHHIGMHTYSMYVFNLEANSIDIYVRSTDDGGTFTPDFRIYTNEANKNNKKIVFPIKTQNAQPYISLGAGPDRSAKAYYISEEFLEYIKEYTLRIGQLRQSIGSMIEADKNELYENIELEEDAEEQEEVLYNYLYADIGKHKDEDEVEHIIDSIFTLNKEKIYDNFWGFLQRLCQRLEKQLLYDQIEEGDIVRFHFRYLADRTAFTYLKLCASFPDYINPDEHELSDMKFGELIEAAYKTKRGLVYSANKSFCNSKLKEKWTNFLTIVPSFNGNEFERRYSEIVMKSYPLITFGVTTNSNKFDKLLYCMDYFSFDQMLSEMIDSYIKVFRVDVNKFCNWVKGEMKKESRLNNE